MSQFQHKLDLGCGTAKVAGALGVDVVPLAGVDVVADLAHRPYPFADNSFDVIWLNDVIEHIPNTIRTMEEVYRLLRPDGLCFVRVVNWNSVYTAMDPTHVNAYTENSFDFFGKRVIRSYYTQARFDVVSVKRGFNDLAKRLCPNERLLYFFSNYFCNVLEDLNFELRAVKQPLAHNPTGEDRNWTTLLRCPAALALGRSGRLERVHESWLVSRESGHKYPIRDGMPIMSIAEGARWKDTGVDDLPESPGDLLRVPVERVPLASVANPDSLKPILKLDDFYHEMVGTYKPILLNGLKQGIKKGLTALSPLRPLRWSARKLLTLVWRRAPGH